MKKILMLLLAVLLLTACTSANTPSDDKNDGGDTPTVEKTLWDEIQDRGVIRVGTEGTYSPKSFHDEDDNLVGFDVDIARAIAEELGVKVEFVETDWNSLFAALDAGRIDIICNEVAPSDERREKYDFSVNYAYEYGAILVLDSNTDINGVADLEGKKAAQNASSEWGLKAESYGAEVLPVSAMSESVDMVLSGRADFTVNAQVAFADYMKQHPDVAVKMITLVEEGPTSISAIPVVKGNEDLVAALDSALAKLQSSGKLAEISEKYLGIDVTHE